MSQLSREAKKVKHRAQLLTPSGRRVLGVHAESLRWTMEAVGSPGAKQNGKWYPIKTKPHHVFQAMVETVGFTLGGMGGGVGEF